MSSSARLVLVVGIVATGCGSQVSVGGSGGGGASSSSVGGGDGGGGAVSPACAQVCEARATCLEASTDECAASCTEQVGGCGPEYQALHSCNITEGASECSFSSSCNSALVEYLNCIGSNGGVSGQCDASGGMCVCAQNYSSGHSLSVACGDGGNGCDCTLDGVLVGHCDTKDFTGCSLAKTCCEQLVAAAGLAF